MISFLSQIGNIVCNFLFQVQTNSQSVTLLVQLSVTLYIIGDAMAMIIRAGDILVHFIRSSVLRFSLADHYSIHPFQ